MSLSGMRCTVAAMRSVARRSLKGRGVRRHLQHERIRCVQQICNLVHDAEDTGRGCRNQDAAEFSESRSDIVTGPIEAVPSVFAAAQGLRLFELIFSFHNNRPQQQRMNGALGKFHICKMQMMLLSGIAVYASGILLSTSRHYKTKPTHGIGRYKHLIKAQELKKKKGKVEVRPINLGTDYEYGVLNVHLTAYDMALAESYAQYIHNLCNHLSIKVEESYAMPTKTMEVLRLQDQGSKMVLDSVLTTHERVVQISGLSATFAEIFLEIIQSNLPEGVKLSVKEHTEEDFKGRFKARPELEELLAKLN
ncbi:39S ribosomal protein L48, mitochondrial [Pteropus alecto]|uniref:Large ribosomal subunit protein mL48 n=1 Tax=Pteropus alecto TaxID=9402 RepID=L5JNK8_PTEAL|nr:39S ribosomal protein L48, mitochondrial [Pteropus alecto]